MVSTSSIVFANGTKHVKDTTCSNCPSRVAYVPGDNPDNARPHDLRFSADRELKCAFEHVNYLFVVMRMLGKRSARIDGPVGKGHSFGMNELHMASWDQFLLDEFAPIDK
jgi:hypothetical protein